MKNDKIQSYMNTIRNTLFLGIICAVTTVSSTAHEFEFNKIYPKKSVKTQVRKEIVTFFSEYLSGKTTTFDAGKSLKLSEVEQYRDAVWQLWKEANAGFEEEKLIALDTLSSASTGYWKCPVRDELQKSDKSGEEYRPRQPAKRKTIRSDLSAGTGKRSADDLADEPTGRAAGRRGI